MRRVCVCGHFGGNELSLDGQTVKTKTVAEELALQLGESEVETIDTHGGKRSLPRVLAAIPRALKGCANFVMMPAQNGLRVLTPALLLFNLPFGRRLHYVVIGGWLPAFIEGRRLLAGGLKRFDFIYVETGSMKERLEGMGFSNVVVMPNCKRLRILDPNELEYGVAEPLRLCTFSRVMEEKGIEDAVRAVGEANAALGRTAFGLDIYGRVDAGQRDWFEGLRRRFGEGVAYRGEVPPERAPEALRPYFALLFPTRFRTEGVPGTVIDAYAAGVPVICSDWDNRREIVEDGVTGRVYGFGDYEGLLSLLLEIAADPEALVRLKPACLERAREYGPEAVVGKALIGGALL